MNHDVILQLTQDFFEEISKLPASNLQVAVNKYYELWYKDGGLASILDEAGLGVYKVIASILVKAGYVNATERHVGQCIRRYEKKHGLRIPNSDVLIPAGVITRKLGITPKDDEQVAHGGVSPNNGTHSRLKSSPEIPKEIKPSNSAETVSGSNWWDDVAQSLGIEIKAVSSDFNWSTTRLMLYHENSDNKKCEFTKEQLELLGHVLLIASKNKLPMNKISKVRDSLYLEEQKKAVFELIDKADRMEVIDRLQK